MGCEPLAERLGVEADPVCGAPRPDEKIASRLGFGERFAHRWRDFELSSQPIICGAELIHQYGVLLRQARAALVLAVREDVHPGRGAF